MGTTSCFFTPEHLCHFFLTRDQGVKQHLRSLDLLYDFGKMLVLLLPQSRLALTSKLLPQVNVYPTISHVMNTGLLIRVEFHKCYFITER